LSNLFQNSFKSHGALSIGLRVKKTSDGLLSSEDLKRGEGDNHPSRQYTPFADMRL
jgi:hypothetical protein